jgi:hypothetical protein
MARANPRYLRKPRAALARTLGGQEMFIGIG